MFNHVAAVVATLKARKLAKEKEVAEASAKADRSDNAGKAVADQSEEKR